MSLKHNTLVTDDLTITYKYDWVLNKKGSKHYMNFTKSSLDFDIGGASFYLENLFNGDKLLGKLVNSEFVKLSLFNNDKL